MTETDRSGAEALLARLSERDREMLDDLVIGFDQCVCAGRNPEWGVAPLDCGGSNGSDHSYRLGKLVKIGLADHRKVGGGEWGKSSTRYRGSKRYRPTQLGREVAALARATTHQESGNAHNG